MAVLEARVRMVMGCLVGEARREESMWLPIVPLPWKRVSEVGEDSRRRKTYADDCDLVWRRHDSQRYLVL